MTRLHPQLAKLDRLVTSILLSILGAHVDVDFDWDCILWIEVDYRSFPPCPSRHRSQKWEALPQMDCLVVS